MKRLTLSEAFLAPSGFAYDPSAFDSLLECFAFVPEEERQEFRKKASAMRYEDFLKTVYWGVIRGRVLVNGRTCRTCGSPSRLQLHHASYTNHGDEHNHLEDLDLICRICHKVRHGLASVEELAATHKRRLGFHDNPARLDSDTRTKPPISGAQAAEELVVKWQKTYAS